MNWSIQQNKKGSKCLITCKEGVRFIRVKVTYNTYDVDKDSRGKEVWLFVPFNSWRKKNTTSKSKMGKKKRAAR
jgi:hypothetical protein